MLLSIAVVTTDASARYGKQLLSHLGHKVTMEPLPDRPAPAGRLLFAYGIGTVLPMPGELILRATAADPESLAHVQDVLQHTQGNKSETARLLGISRSRLQRYVEKFKLDVPD